MRSIELCPTLDSSSDFAGTVPIMSSSDLIRLKKTLIFFEWEKDSDRWGSPEGKGLGYVGLWRVAP